MIQLHPATEWHEHGWIFAALRFLQEGGTALELCYLLQATTEVEE